MFSTYRNGKKIDPAIICADLDPEEINIFESLRTYGRVIFHEEEHLQRLLESSKTTGIPLPVSIKTIQKDMRLAIEAFDKEPENSDRKETEDLFIRIMIWRDQVIFFVGARIHPKKIYEEGVILETTCIRRSNPNAAAPQAKTGAYQNGVLAALNPGLNTYERLFLDSEGFVAEVSIGNIFIVKRSYGSATDTIMTPPAHGILNGVTRRFVIECAALAGIKVTESPLSRHDVYNADEAFLTNTSWEVLPVRELDRRQIGKLVPGPLTTKIHRLFRERALRECRRSKSAAH